MKYSPIIAITVCVAAFLTVTHMARGEEEFDARLDRQLREAALRRKPAIFDLPIGWQENRSPGGESAWHILGTIWRVRLHPEAHGLERLDKESQFEVHGLVLDQNYGVIDVWVYELKRR